MKNCIKHLGFCKLQVCWCRAGGLKGMKSCIKYLGFCKLQVCWCRAGGLKGVKNQSKPSVLQDSDPLVGCVYGIYLSAVCVWVLKRSEKPIKAQCFASVGAWSKNNQSPVLCKIRIYWLAVCMPSTGRLCVWVVKRFWCLAFNNGSENIFPRRWYWDLRM